MLNFGQEVVGVQVVTIVFFQIEGVAGHESATATRSGDYFVTGFLLLHVDLGQFARLALIQIDAGIVVDLVGAVLRDADDGGFIGQETGAGGLEVVIGQRILPGAQLLLDLKTRDHVFRLQNAETGVKVRLPLVGQAWCALWELATTIVCLPFSCWKK